MIKNNVRRDKEVVKAKRNTIKEIVSMLFYVIIICMLVNFVSINQLESKYIVLIISLIMYFLVRLSKQAQ